MIIMRPPASPSKPSVKFTELAEARIMNMNNGIYHHPSTKSPIPGTWIWS